MKEKIIKDVTPNLTPFTGEYTYATGKRKTAIAQVRLYKGHGAIIINAKDIKDYVTVKDLIDVILSPLTLTDLLTKFDISIVVRGGGVTAQAEAIRHGISRALIAKDILLRPTLKKAGLLTRDPRIKERKKPGLKRARRAPQWSKR
jgi:small subunit ribosomal protein S9